MTLFVFHDYLVGQPGVGPVATDPCCHDQRITSAAHLCAKAKAQIAEHQVFHAPALLESYAYRETLEESASVESLLARLQPQNTPHTPFKPPRTF